MSGGSWDRVMGNMVSTGAFYSSSAGFGSAPEEKYYDKYTNDTVNTTYSRGKLGDATKETRSWYNDSAYLVSSSLSWFNRSGIYSNGTGAGVFLFGRSDGGVYVDAGSRTVLS